MATDQCNRCEYAGVCNFWLYIYHNLTGTPCMQGRKRRIMRQAAIEEFKEVTE